MVKITFVEHNGTEHVVDTTEGVSVMEAALQNSIAGIDGDCGGQCACATCHVYVDPVWLTITGRADPEIEESMIELNEHVQENSRLACQIRMTKELDGLVLRIPALQF